MKSEIVNLSYTQIIGPCNKSLISHRTCKHWSYFKLKLDGHLVLSNENLIDSNFDAMMSRFFCVEL